ncbi:MAG: hypothetical protein QXU98_04195 [Candidatus Parvarchaeota archaeon]
MVSFATGTQIYNLQNYIDNAVTPYTNIYALKPTATYILPHSGQYKVYLSELIAIPTALTQIISFPMPFNAYVKQIAILPSSNASANGVMFTLQYGQNTIDALNGNQSGLAVPVNIQFTDGEYPKLNVNDPVILTASASASGSFIQLAIIFEVI